MEDVVGSVVGTTASDSPAHSGRPRRQTGRQRNGIEECQQLGMRARILASGPHAWKPGHLCIKGPSSGVTIFEKAADAIMGELGRRNPGWQSRVERSTTQAFFLAEHEGEWQAVTFATYTDTNDCAVVVHLFATREDCRKRGHGKSMLSLLEEHAHSQGKALLIEYSPSVQDSKLFWVKRGYTALALDCNVGFGSKPNTTEKVGLRRWYPGTPIWCVPPWWADNGLGQPGRAKHRPTTVQELRGVEGQRASAHRRAEGLQREVDRLRVSVLPVQAGPALPALPPMTILTGETLPTTTSTSTQTRETYRTFWPATNIEGSDGEDSIGRRVRKRVRQ